LTGGARKTWFWAGALGAAALYAISPQNELGDTYHYALAIEAGNPTRLFEASHLLWRPLGRAMWPAFASPDGLRIISVMFAALGVGTAAVWLRRRLPAAVAAAATVLLGLGYAWWSYTTTACAYVAATSLGLMAMTLAWPEEGRRPGSARLWLAALLQSLASLISSGSRLCCSPSPSSSGSPWC
jgi:hypothetical protein